MIIGYILYTIGTIYLLGLFMKFFKLMFSLSRVPGNYFTVSFQNYSPVIFEFSLFTFNFKIFKTMAIKKPKKR